MAIFLCEETYDVCVIGGGSAGFGAALAAARAGLSTVLVEAGDSLGGNAVRGGVHNWEPGVGGTAFPREIFDRLCDIPLATGIWSMGRHWCWSNKNDPPFPGGELLVDPACTYEDTLHRHGTRGLAVDFEKVQQQWHGVVFEPEPYAATLEEMLRETGQCRILKETQFVSAKACGRNVTEAQLAGKEGKPQRLGAHHFIDATADALLCQSIGCETLVGEDPKAAFHEPSAPVMGNKKAINAVTLIYRISPVSSPRIESLPQNIPSRCWYSKNWSGAAIGQYPCGERNINMLPTMEGDEFFDFILKGSSGYRAAYEECRRRVLGHWHWIQTEFPEFRHFRLNWIAPSLGVRESRRVVGEYVLTERDVIGGLSSQGHSDIIAIADHALDIHGTGNRSCPELTESYGIPFRCLVPKGWLNLSVVGRCASFSHIAASSCRLSRTMMDLGHAAGLAAAIALKQGANIAQIDPSLLRETLKKQGATLEPSEPGQLASGIPF